MYNLLHVPAAPSSSLDSDQSIIVPNRVLYIRESDFVNLVVGEVTILGDIILFHGSGAYLLNKQQSIHRALIGSSVLNPLVVDLGLHTAQASISA